MKFSITYLSMNPGEFPHSEISGSMLICSSPKLIAAYHVFHRLPVPRHSPCALVRLTFQTFFKNIWYPLDSLLPTKIIVTLPFEIVIFLKKELTIIFVGKRESSGYQMFLKERLKGQANKGAGRMPWHWEPMKDVISCDKLRGAANKH